MNEPSNWEWVARVDIPGTPFAGTGFLLAPSLLLTCAHLLRSPSSYDGSRLNYTRQAEVTWPLISDEVHQAEVILHQPWLDAALLRIAANSDRFVQTPKIGTLIQGQTFHTYGFRDADYFQGLHAAGEILGPTIRLLGTERQPLLQLATTGIVGGMSGAPVVISHAGDSEIIGMVSGAWVEQRSRATEFGFGVPMSAVKEWAKENGVDLSNKEIPSSQPAPHDPTSPRYIAAVTSLLYDGFTDGSWARSLASFGGRRFSTDVQPTHSGAEYPRRAVSITALAANTVLAAYGSRASEFLQRTSRWVDGHYDPTVSGVGYIHRSTSSAPLVGGYKAHLFNIRHTASALRFWFEAEAIRRRHVESLLKLLDAQHSDGWGEFIGAEPDSIATIMAVNALSASRQRLEELERFVDDKQPVSFADRVVRAEERAWSWLAQHQNEDGTWSYGEDAALAKNRPYYTAMVLAYAPQVLQFPSAWRRVSAYISKELVRCNGIPESEGDQASLSSTALTCHGLLAARRVVSTADDLAEQVWQSVEKQMDARMESRRYLTVHESTGYILSYLEHGGQVDIVDLPDPAGVTRLPDFYDETQLAAVVGNLEMPVRLVIKDLLAPGLRTSEEEY